MAAVTDLDALMSKLTLDEKILLLSGADYWKTNAVPRVGIPALKMTDGPNGARGEFVAGEVSTACFPAATSLGASWDPDLVRRIGNALAEESKTKGAQVLLGPCVCTHRDPRGGRNFEAYSEDPLLAGSLAGRYIQGVQENGIGATIKHFAANEQETLRFSVDARISERALREIYLKPFEIAIKYCKPWAVMTSYNSVNGHHSDSNDFLLTKVLREQWGFKGMVMSDWGGTNSTAEALDAGLDLEMPGPAYRRNPDKIKAALESGSLMVETIDQRVRKNLELLSNANLFEEPQDYQEKAIDQVSHRQLIRQAGAEGAVLLKNQDNILPLSKERLKSVALIGLYDEFLGHGGGCAAINNPHHRVTPYQALREAFKDSVDMRCEKGAYTFRGLPAMNSEVVDDHGNPGFTRRTIREPNGPETIDNVRRCYFNPLHDGLEAHSVSLEGTYCPTISGKHYLSFVTSGKTKVFINDELFFHNEEQSSEIQAIIWDVGKEERKQYEFVSGKRYRIRVEAQAVHNSIGAPDIYVASVISFSVGFMTRQEFEMDLLTPAVEAAEKSDVAIVFVGNSPSWETEGVDRESMDLPSDGSLDRLITAVAAANKKTIVVNSSASPITMPWLSDIQGLIQMWFPGQEAGYAIADVLLGLVSPGGKLPVTFPRHLEDAPTYKNFPGDTKRGIVEYKEDVFLGYRFYDEHPEAVLFPFGFGLSYTTFQVSNVTLSKNKLGKGESLNVIATVENFGNVGGSEVVQVYVGSKHRQADIEPMKTLVGYNKVKLNSNETARVDITFGVEQIAHWADDTKSWEARAGEHVVFVGTSAMEIVASLTFSIPEPIRYGA